jgi:Uma2 family endonuclease
MIATADKPLTPTGGPEQSIPALENGDRLTVKEFLRRYEAMPHIKKAELIEGIVYMGSPVRADVHGTPDSLLQMWLGVYMAGTPGTIVIGNSTVKLDVDNVPQPDSALRILEEFGGQSRLVNGYVEGAPELIVEIAASSASIDLHTKLNTYRRNGVLEYLVCQALDAKVHWFALKDGEFKPIDRSSDGLYRSGVFPGLVLDSNALCRGDAAGVLAALNKGLADPAHAEFVAKLNSSRR